MKRWLCWLVLIPFIAVASMAQAADPVGKLKTVVGDGVVVRAGAETKAVLGMPIHNGDVLRTAKNAALGVMFVDDSTVSLGSDSELVIDEVVFDPKGGNYAFKTNAVTGSFVFLTGGIAKASPDSTQVKTRLSTLGIRGTRFAVNIPRDDSR